MPAFGGPSAAVIPPSGGTQAPDSHINPRAQSVERSHGPSRPAAVESIALVSHEDCCAPIITAKSTATRLTVGD